MFRFVAIVWNANDARRAAAAADLRERLHRTDSEWRSAYSQAGLEVSCAGGHGNAVGEHLLADGQGIILGQLFHKSAGQGAQRCQSRDLSCDETTRIVSSGARRLARDYWGNYLAFVRVRHGNVLRVFKDPCGNLPCYWARTEGVIVLFSCISDCRVIGVDFAINRRFLIEHLVWGSRDPGKSPLIGLSQVHRGECVSFDAAAASPNVGSEYLWMPSQFANQDSRCWPRVDDAASDLHDVVNTCTQTLASMHEGVLVRLSGGLDSSIVLGCLTERAMRSERSTTAYTYYAPSGRSDERRWARMAAAKAGCEHLEVPFDPALDRLQSVTEFAPAVEPESLFSYLQRADLERRLSRERNATAIFTGQGGDSGLGSDSIPFAVVEHLQRCGLRPSIVQLAIDVALRTDLTFWTVLGRSLSRWMQGSRMLHQREMVMKGCTLVTEEVRATVNDESTYPHPWFSTQRDVPWSVIRRLGMLLHSPEYYDLSVSPSVFSPEIVSPLYAQPVIEMCLRIPAHVLFADGRDRGLARRAFTREVPLEILRRQWKDRAPGAAHKIVRQNIVFLRELLLEGALVAAGLLDRRAVEDALSDAPKRTTTYPGEILKHLDAEVWTRNWSSTEALAASA